MNKKPLIWIAIFWLVIVGVFIAVNEYTLQTGEEVLLKTRPVDPRDLFRGDYVVLSYDISSFDMPATDQERAGFTQGDNVYVPLEIVNGYGTAALITKTKPTSGLFLRGELTRTFGGRLNIEYGIESYFVPEGEGREIERIRDGSLDVLVAIDDRGYARIKELQIAGEPVTFNTP